MSKSKQEIKRDKKRAKVAANKQRRKEKRERIEMAIYNLPDPRHNLPDDTILTRDIINSLGTKSGWGYSWSKQTLAYLGVDYPHKEGWIEEIINKPRRPIYEHKKQQPTIEGLE
jgi:hypothetical protein